MGGSVGNLNETDRISKNGSAWFFCFSAFKCMEPAVQLLKWLTRKLHRQRMHAGYSKPDGKTLLDRQIMKPQLYARTLVCG